MITIWKNCIAYWQPWFNGWMVAPGIVLFIAGARHAVKKQGILLLPIIAFPFLLLYATGSGMRLGDTPFIFWTRRYMDASTPIFLLFISLGAWWALKETYANLRNARRWKAYRFAWLVPVILIMGLTANSLFHELDIWKKMLEDYYWNTRNINEVDVAAGEWVNENTDESDTVLVFDAGAIKYFGNRFTYDVVGLNSAELMGREHIDTIITEKPDYLAIWAIYIFDNMPNATKVATFTTERNTILGNSAGVGIYQMDWHSDIFKDPNRFYLDITGEVLDMFVPTDRESALSHNHYCSFVSYAPHTAGRIEGVPIIDRGISHGGPVTERFTMEAQTGKRLTLVVRYRCHEEGPPAQVTVNGTVMEPWHFDASPGEFMETSLAIPSEIVNEDIVTIELEWDIGITTFRWWSVIE